MMQEGIEAMAATDVSGGNQAGAEFGRVRVGRDGVRAVVWLSGEHDVATKRAVTAALADAVDAEVDVVVDLADAWFMDASIIGVLIQGCWLLAERGRSLTFRGVQGVALWVIGMCGLAGLIEGPAGVAPDWSMCF
jgi:anti-anti-sigma factor